MNDFFLAGSGLFEHAAEPDDGFLRSDDTRWQTLRGNTEGKSVVSSTRGRFVYLS